MKLTLVLALLYLAVILFAALTSPGTAPGDRRGSVNLGSSPVHDLGRVAADSGLLARGGMHGPGMPSARWRTIAQRHPSQDPS